MTHLSGQEKLELWGGAECTIARIKDTYRDQLSETGHAGRLADIHALAALGIKRLRFPVLWEAIISGKRDWHWHDERLDLLRNLGIEPIIGLLHHGSGPPYTHLLDPTFAEKFAKFADRVARRYPWVRMFTPINEPLTTARFSCLYGHWYPHRKDFRSFLEALVNECHATQLGMEAIRRTIPEARLVLTEDIGKTFGTRRLQYQVKHENERRWLSLDLLTGRVNKQHPWYPLFLKQGISESRLEGFAAARCPPDIIGVNHYLTSERFLDHRLARYPVQYQGTNGRHSYADVEAVRMDLPPWDIGPSARLREVWERYQLPIAVTEVHHGCTRDEQMRWLVEVWEGAQELRRQNVPICAVTIWSLFGSIDWNTLLLGRNNFYEPGAFDIRGSKMRPTALARTARSLAEGKTPNHPIFDLPGWWHRAQRRYGHKKHGTSRRMITMVPRCILITGAKGTLGGAFARICRRRGLEYVLLNRQEMDVADQLSVSRALEKIRPWAIINTAGYVRVAQAEKEAERCMRENTIGAETLAIACAKLGLPYVTFSSDLVFDGQLGRPYTENDQANPTSVYGESKAEAEKLVSLAYPDALIARTSAFFGPWDKYNFVYQLVNSLQNNRAFYASDTIIVSPTYVPDLVHATLDLLVRIGRGGYL